MADDEVSVAGDVCPARKAQRRRGDREVSGLVDRGVEEVCGLVAGQVGERGHRCTAVRERDVDRTEVVAIDDSIDWVFELVHDEVISIAIRIAGLASCRVRGVIDADTRTWSNARREGCAAGQADCTAS